MDGQRVLVPQGIEVIKKILLSADTDFDKKSWLKLICHDIRVTTVQVLKNYNFSSFVFYSIIFSLILGFIGAVVTWKYGLKDYQKNRIETFMEPDKDHRGSGYNSIQSKIAVGSGRFLGKGFRQGTQSQLEFLPERHTDFIYSVLSEEWGLCGGCEFGPSG